MSQKGLIQPGNNVTLSPTQQTPGGTGCHLRRHLTRKTSVSSGCAGEQGCFQSPPGPTSLGLHDLPHSLPCFLVCDTGEVALPRCTDPWCNWAPGSVPGTEPANRGHLSSPCLLSSMEMQVKLVIKQETHQGTSDTWGGSRGFILRSTNASYPLSMRLAGRSNCPFWSHLFAYCVSVCTCAQAADAGVSGSAHLGHE